MLKFQTHPDIIFTTILHESMSLIIDQIRELDNSSERTGTTPDHLETLLPNAGMVFKAETALRVLKNMLVSLKEPWLYVLNNYHYLLLYDTLQYFCEIHNDLVRTAPDLEEKKEVSMIGGIQIEYIDFDDIVGMFFFDTDFLLDTETVIDLGLDKRALLGIHGETFSISQGLSPHPEELALIRDDTEMDYPAEQQLLWSETSSVYPDLKIADQ